MYKQIRALLITVVLFAFSSTLNAQITVSQSSGCEGNFNPVFSAPAGATNIVWTIPNQGSSTSPSVSTNFPPGTTVITLNCTINGSPATYTASVITHPKPTGSFTYQIPALHCAPMTASFTGSAGPGINFTWAFGDLSALGSGVNVIHTYNFSNSFSPVMILTNAATGCTSNATNNSPALIHVSDKPIVNITSSAGWSGCVPPFLTTINGGNSISQSPTGGGLTYSWAGQSVGGTAPSQGQVSFPLGIHTISLTVTDNNQCPNTGVAVITVINPTLTAFVQPTVCLNAPVDVVVNTSQPLVHISGMGAGGSFTTMSNNSTTISAVTIAGPKGQQNLSFQVSSAGCPPLIVTKPVFVEEVVANFLSTPPGATCQSSMAVTYINTSSVNTSAPLTFTWSGATGGIAHNQINPQLIYMPNAGNVTFTISQGSNNPYTIFNLFNPYITLIAKSTSIAQCSANIKIVLYDTLARPTAFFVRDSMQGCVPLTVKFRDSSFFHPLFPITNYTWCNGATPPVFLYNQTQASFSYTNPGTYYPYLIVESSPHGCTDISFFDTITVVTPPKITATYPTQVCANTAVTISMTGTPLMVPSSTAISHWHAETDAGYFSGCITDSTPTWVFTHPGTHLVKLTAYQAGCKSTTTMPQSIQVLGPVGNFLYETYCGPNRTSVTFTVFLDDATGATLNFGDGNQHVISGVSGKTSVVVPHTYAVVGNYNATLLPTTSNNCTPKPFTRQIKLKNPSVSILYDGKPLPLWPEPLACTKAPYLFTATKTDIETACSRGISWTYTTPTYELPPVNCDHGIFGKHIHGLPNSINPVMADPFSRDTFRLAGDYTISVTGRDANGCEASATHKFRISSAVPNFTWAANPACASDNPIQIINNTQAMQVVPDVINSYTWSFGDNQTQTSSNPFDNPIHFYSNVAIPSQTYNVMAIASNTLGCIDTTIHKLQINNPNAGFTVSDLFPCIPLGKGRIVTFGAMQGYATYSVNYGDSPNWQTLGTYNNVSKSYSQPGVFHPTMTVIDAANCKSTNVLTITAIGQPTASFIYPNGTSFCVPGDPVMKSTSLTNITPIDRYSWNFRNIQTPPVANDTILEDLLNIPGQYTVSLTVSIGPYALCPSTATGVVYVYDTQGKIEIDRTTFCLGETIIVKAIDLKDVAKWQWFFGDLVPQNPIFNTQFAPNPISYPYTIYPTASATGSTTLRLQLNSPGDGCILNPTVAIQVIKITGEFTKTDSLYAHCLGLTDVFIKTTPNPLNLDLYHSWDFGDGTTGFGDSVSTIYKAPGSYTVKMSVRDTGYHCSDTAFKKMIIFPNPTSQLFINDTLVCPSDTFDITGNASAGVVTATLTSSVGDHSVSLNPDNTFINHMQVLESDTFTLRTTDLNGCLSPPVEQVIFVPIPAKEVNTSTTIVIGQTVSLNASAGPGYSYSWTPETLALSGTGIFNPVSSTTTDITYTVEIVDEPLHCFVSLSTFSIHVLPLTTVDVPSAFTPNGDGVNDIVFPGGWGIRALNYFRIYNRWGQLLFESNDLAHGWDGTFEGTPQNTETYVYQVEVQTWVDSEPVISKTGTIKLLR